MSRLQIDVWSDIACPWCYVGKRRLEAALERFPHRDEVDVLWRSFELDPGAPREKDVGVPYAQRLARKYGSSVADAEHRLEQMTELARADGLSFHFDLIRPGNTFDAHRILHLAHERGVQDAVKERFLSAYMTEGEPIGQPEVLVRLASEAGLDPDEVADVLDGNAHASNVRADEAEANDIGIHGVPFFVLGGRYALSGAQPAQLLFQALEQAWKERKVEPLPFADGEACGPDGCP
jgi:predicted DsbA family dithiol-disulfide isomerase